MQVPPQLCIHIQDMHRGERKMRRMDWVRFKLVTCRNFIEDSENFSHEMVKARFLDCGIQREECVPHSVQAIDGMHQRFHRIPTFQHLRCRHRSIHPHSLPTPETTTKPNPNSSSHLTQNPSLLTPLSSHSFPWPCLYVQRNQQKQQNNNTPNQPPETYNTISYKMAKRA